MSKIRVAIAGYGNLGKGVESAIKQNPDIELVAVISRRKDLKINTENVKTVLFENVLSLKGEVDVVIICGGSATDLPEMTPYLAEHFTVVDRFDNHANIPAHKSKVNEKAINGNLLKKAVFSRPRDKSVLKATAEIFFKNEELKNKFERIYEKTYYPNVDGTDGFYICKIKKN